MPRPISFQETWPILAAMGWRIESGNIGDRLADWSIYPETEDSLQLEVVTVVDSGGRVKQIHSLDSRRLYCLKQFQEQIRASGWSNKAQVATNQCRGGRLKSRSRQRSWTRRPPKGQCRGFPRGAAELPDSTRRGGRLADVEQLLST